jgi:tetratricopeptide (TPR) repeat protein
LKADHLKRKGDQALKDGNYRLAWETYTDAIAAKPDKEGLHLLYSNRSLAHYKAQRYQEALADADEASTLAPSWPKAQWRRAAALLGMRKVSEAVDAFHSAWQLDPRDEESRSKLWNTILKLTREQLAAKILDLLADLEAAAGMRKPHMEKADDVIIAEAAFKLVAEAHRGKQAPGPYHTQYMKWLTARDGLPIEEAYSLRSAVNFLSKAYLQARADAQAAIDVLGEQHAAVHRDMQSLAGANGGGSAHGALRAKLSSAFRRLGDAHLAERKHVDRDPYGAFKAYMRAIEIDEGGDQTLRDKLQEATDELTKEGVEAANAEVYHEGILPGWPLERDGWSREEKTAGSPDALRGSPRMFRAELILVFPQGRLSAFGPPARLALRSAVASVANVDPSAVTFEGVRPRQHSRGLQVTVHAMLGAEVANKGAALRRIFTAIHSNASGHSGDDPQHDDPPGAGNDAFSAADGNGAVVGAIGMFDPAQCQVVLTDMTPRHMVASQDVPSTPRLSPRDGAISAPQPPKTELEAPYKMYRLVTSNGCPVERSDKHPFCMSRVYYEASERPDTDETWVELADGSCRWRQTGGEIKVLALRVPQGLPPRELGVNFEPFGLRVWHKITGEVYLEGRLHRGIVPEECFWTHCGGEGEDGCCLTLQKMNLEVLRKHWAHSESWWPRLFEGHADIAWDDYEKDYSDLPEQVLAKHRLTEGVREDGRRLENAERGTRELLQEADDKRKRKRQERLRELRDGA